MQIISQNFKGNMNFIKQGPLEFLCFTISYHYPSYLKFYWHSYNIPVNFFNSFSFLTVSGDSVNSSSLFNGTFNAYWNTSPARWSWTIHDFPLNDSWIIFMKCSWKVHEDPMNLLLDILKSWIFVHEKMLMNIHEHTFSWIIHEQLYSWSFIIWWMSNNKFIGSSWTVHE